MQMLLDLISFSASHAAVSTLTNCSYSVMCILQLYEAQAEQSQSSNYKMVQLFSERCFCDGLLLTLFTIYLGLGEEWSSFSYNLLKLSSENWLTFIYLGVFLMFQCKKGTYYGQLWLWSPLIFVLFDLCPNTKGHSLNIRTTEAFSSLKIGRNICAWGACGFYHSTEGFSFRSSVLTPDISSQ